MEQLYINNLIEKAQEFVHNGRLNNTAYGKMPLQKIELDSNTFDLSLVAEAKYDKTKPLPDDTGMYVVKIESQEGIIDTTIGYWNSEEWERVRAFKGEESEYPIAEYPTFQDMAFTVISWKPINKNW